MTNATEVACVNTAFLQLKNNENMVSEWYAVCFDVWA